MNFKLMNTITVKDVLIWILMIMVTLLSYMAFKDIYVSLGLLMIMLSVYIYFRLSRKDLFHPVALFSGFWIGVAGLTNFRLSGFQHKWSLYMFLVVFTVYFTFIIGYYIGRKTKIRNRVNYGQTNVKKLYFMIIITLIACVLCFVAEIVILRFVPLFDPRMEAYQLFHVSGLHYFTVTCGILPCLTIVYKGYGGKNQIWFINVVAFAIPVLIISRQVLLLQVISSLVVYNYIYKKVSMPVLISVGLASMIIFSMLLKLRHQDTDYINEVSNIKIMEEVNNDEHSIMNVIQNNDIGNKVLRKLVQPYMYLTMNFENLRNIVENFNDYQYGKNSIFPIFAFTNTKKYIDYSYKEKYLTNENFNTSTFMSDIYFDFGYIGAIFIPMLFGLVFGRIYKGILENRKDKLTIAIYSVLIYCLIFCFFVPWYSSPTIWFYVGIIFLIWLGSRMDYSGFKIIK